MGNNWKNNYLDCHVHHVTCTVHKWQKALLYPEILNFLYEEFNKSISRWNVSFIGYVIMPEHFHLLLHSIEGDTIKKAISGIRRAVSGQVRLIVESRNKELIRYCWENKVDMDIFYTGTCSKSDFRFWKEKPRVFPMNFEDEIRKNLIISIRIRLERGLWMIL
jgi:REP element-mobilizing transposase RayT